MKVVVDYILGEGIDLTASRAVLDLIHRQAIEDTWLLK